VDEKEFNTIKNMVLRHADGLNEMPESSLLSGVNDILPESIRLAMTCANVNRPHPSFAVSSVASLLKNMNNIIADDYFDRFKKHYDRIDKKLLEKLLQKKQEHGMRQSFE
jgi:hypothetical protein